MNYTKYFFCPALDKTKKMCYNKIAKLRDVTKLTPISLQIGGDNMQKVAPWIDTAMITIGISYSLDNIRTVLGIVILSLQLLWILFKLIIRLINAIKNPSDLDKSDTAFDDAIGSLTDIYDKLPKEKEGKKNGSTEKQE